MDKPPIFLDILEAQERIKDFITQTPFIWSPALNDAVGANVWVKAECLQARGSFKIRGACNAIFKHKEEAIKRGVIAYSSGNHAQGVALACRIIGAKSKIIVPHDVPFGKLQAAKDDGAEIIFYNRQTESREEIGVALQKQTGAILIPPYDHKDVIAGQGTIGLEIAQFGQSRNIIFDNIILQASGGGLASGIALALEELSPKTKMIIGEPENHNDLMRSLLSGQFESNSSDAKQSIQDALMAPSPGKITFPILKNFGAIGIGVSDYDVLRAIKFAFNHLKIVLEPGGACGLGAALFGGLDLAGKNICIIASGGNIEATTFIKALELI